MFNVALALASASASEDFPLLSCLKHTCVFFAYRLFFHSLFLLKVRAALQQLAQGDCQAEPWPLYSSSEVAKHKTAEKGIWVSYKERTHFITFQKRIVHVDLCEAHVTQLVCSLLMSICARAYIVLQEGVYDITKFIENHPGGKDKIMLAAGKAIDPFWSDSRTKLVFLANDRTESDRMSICKLTIGARGGPGRVEALLGSFKLPFATSSKDAIRLEAITTNNKKLLALSCYGCVRLSCSEGEMGETRLRVLLCRFGW